jgi:Hypothetical protein (DUF2513)
MRRYMDLVREILVQVEAMPLNQAWRGGIEGHSQDEVFYHVEQVKSSGLVEADLMNPNGHIVYDLTPDGHDFLAAARSSKVWDAAKKMLMASAGAITVPAMKTALHYLMQKAAQSGLS